MQLLNLLTSPALLYSLIAILTTSSGGFLFKSCSSQHELSQMQQKYSELQEEHRRVLSDHLYVQGELTKQSKQIELYNNLAGRYHKELEAKYTTPTPPPQPCNFDFTFANSLLYKQGTKP